MPIVVAMPSVSFHAAIAIPIAGFCCWLLLADLTPRLRRRLLDQPNARSSHVQPTPRGGGVAFVLISSIASATAWLASISSASAPLALLAAPLLALPLALVGLLDDRHNLPASWRYGVQLATALVVVLSSPLVALSVQLLPLLALLVIFVTALINFTNFMDGLDGLVAGCMVVAITSAAIQLAAPWPIWALVGALLGFLIWNWSPAKVFMVMWAAPFLVLFLQSSCFIHPIGMKLLSCCLCYTAAVRCLPLRTATLSCRPSGVSGPSSSSISALASGRLAPCPCLQPLHLSHRSDRSRLDLGGVALGNHSFST